MGYDTQLVMDGGRTEYGTDDRGRHVRTIDYDAAGNVIWAVHYERDRLGRIIEWRSYDGEGTLCRRVVVTYPAPGVEETWQFDRGGMLTSRSIERQDAFGVPHRRVFDGMGRDLTAA